jgi:hypothetical protein
MDTICKYKRRVLGVIARIGGARRCDGAEETRPPLESWFIQCRLDFVMSYRLSLPSKLYLPAVGEGSASDACWFEDMRFGEIADAVTVCWVYCDGLHNDVGHITYSSP